jgi:bifunctional non-homologous end joining protein LigD
MQLSKAFRLSPAPAKADSRSHSFIEPMYARLVNELPEGKEWLYEVKFDGYRCLGSGCDRRTVVIPISRTPG